MTAPSHSAPLSLRQRCAGRALLATESGWLYLSRKYGIFKSCDDGQTWQPFARLPLAGGRALVGLSRLGARLLRLEVRALLCLADGSSVASNRKTVYFLAPGETVMQPARIATDGPAPWPPMTLTSGPNDRVVWGEYSSNRERRAVRLYASDDGGRSYAVAYAFKPGEIRHVHNLYFDAALRKYWVLAGDHDAEPGIGLLSEDLHDLDWVVKGDQIHRAVALFDLGDRLIYGTDTEKAPNAVMSLDKATGRLRRVAETDGSCIYACRFGGLYAITTSIEPSTVNTCRSAKLLVSRDGEGWQEVFAAPKDRWDENYFQFGSLVLPRGAYNRESIFFSGQALKGIDGKAIIASLNSAEAGDRREARDVQRTI